MMSFLELNKAFMSGGQLEFWPATSFGYSLQENKKSKTDDCEEKKFGKRKKKKKLFMLLCCSEFDNWHCVREQQLVPRLPSETKVAPYLSSFPVSNSDLPFQPA
ncbi:hypothetical protein S83_054915 [Arachis hypogaea]|nr:uncharacterized protein DS421_16g541750 [Arachis hypogaea]